MMKRYMCLNEKCVAYEETWPVTWLSTEATTGFGGPADDLAIYCGACGDEGEDRGFYE